MEKAKVNGIEIEYEVEGAGEPVLLIGTGPIADSFLPLFSEEALAGRYRLIRYRQRGQVGGQVGSTHDPMPVSYAQHAADASALLRYLDIHRAHVAGHSTGAVIALQLGADRPEVVETLALLEPTLVGVPSTAGFLPSVPTVLGALEPALAAYGAGDREGAMVTFLSVVCNLDWQTCRRVIDERVPGGVEQAMRDAGGWFGSYLPGLGQWQFGHAQASDISRPVLSVLGTESGPLFEEGQALLHFWLPQVEDCTIEGVGHLLHIQRPEPVARGLAEFFARHPISAGLPANNSSP